MTLDDIRQENDIHKAKPEEYDEIAAEIRKFLIEHVSRTGGHLSSNLGTVELTMALHLVLHFPEDKLIWDVGHQSYTHKILTGRKDEFDSLRQTDGLSGFPKRRESDCDPFDTGHSSTAISAGLGFVQARDLNGDHYRVVAVIGDGSMTGGLAYEALSNAALLTSNFIIVLNDNGMSISRNVGGMSHYLWRLRTAKSYTDFKDTVNHLVNKIPEVGGFLAEKIHRVKEGIKQLFTTDMFFEDMGITYFGPVDGHDIGAMCKVFEDAKRVAGPVIVHVHTKKGKGYGPAEQNPAKYHGVGPFDPKTGAFLQEEEKTYTKVFSDAVTELGRENKKLVAVTAAMEEGTGLSLFHQKYPERFFDVGIAEEHAVTFSAGMAASGLHPVVAIYSSFLQRAYDQILHDVCLQNLPVTFAIDRAGIVGGDGETHQGVFDLSYLASIPGMTVAAPCDAEELKEMLAFAVSFNGPFAIRYPRGKAPEALVKNHEPIRPGKAEVLVRKSGTVLLALGSMVETALQAAEILEDAGVPATVVNMRFASPVDTELMTSLLSDHTRFVTLEENVKSGGFGEHVAAFLEESKKKADLLIFALPDEFIEQGKPEEVKKKLHFDADSIAKALLGRTA